MIFVMKMVYKLAMCIIVSKCHCDEYVPHLVRRSK